MITTERGGPLRLKSSLLKTRTHHRDDRCVERRQPQCICLFGFDIKGETMKRHKGWKVRSVAVEFVPALILALVTLVAAVVCFPGISAAKPVIVTDQGPLRGLTVSGEQQFLGIPYAAPPVGSLRWLPPRPPPGSKECSRRPSSAALALSQTPMQPAVPSVARTA